MDKIEHWEIYTIIENLHYTDTNTWEQARLLFWSISSLFSKKKISAKELLQLPWDKEENKETSISNEEIEMLTRKSKNIERMLNNGSDTNKTD